MPSRSVLSSANGKLGKARIAHERFESNDAPLGHSRHLTRRSPGRARPTTQNRQWTMLRAPLSSHRRLPGVTVHGVEFSGMSKNNVPPPAASAWLPVCGAFPLGTAGFVEVHVRVDEPWKHVKTARVDLATCTFQHRERSRRCGLRTGGCRPSLGRPGGRACRRGRWCQSRWASSRSLRNCSPARAQPPHRRARTFSAGLWLMPSLAAKEHHSRRHASRQGSSRRGPRR